MESNEISGQVVDAAMKVHSALGPGLLESDLPYGRWARDRKAVELYGKHAWLNFPEEWTLGADSIYRSARAG